jgi:hypothetical protein
LGFETLSDYEGSAGKGFIIISKGVGKKMVEGLKNITIRFN